MGISGIERWEEKFFPFNVDETVSISPERQKEIMNTLINRLNDNYPFFHPSYIGQMLKPPHQIAVAAYLTTMLINPNNHALDGGPATAQMEKEAVEEIAKMFGLTSYLGHLTSSGTIANLEALWVARELNPAKKIVFSSQAHYTHGRMTQLIGAPHEEIETDNKGRIDLNRLEDRLKKGDVSTVVLTVGTTGLGAIDPVDQVIPFKDKYGIRIHVDAAYGGFFILLAKEGLVNPAPFSALRYVDSIAIDPHKHGLQPYGCGCILFSDPKIGKLYAHNSPYTYFTSNELHLGEISLECSRAGASAAALWATLQVFPLKSNEGLGLILKKCRQAALKWHSLMHNSEGIIPFIKPELDIIVYFPEPKEKSLSMVSKLSERLFSYSMSHPEKPLFLSKLKVPSLIFNKNFPDFEKDREEVTLLRSVLMKPEQYGLITEINHLLYSYFVEIKRDI